MTDTQNLEEIPTIAGKSPDMTQNSDKIALLNKPGRLGRNSDHVESYTNIMIIPIAKETNSENHVKSYTNNLTPPSDNKQQLSQIVHHLNNQKEKKKMKLSLPKTPSSDAKVKPKTTGSRRRKSPKTNDAGSEKELEGPPKLKRTPETNAFETAEKTKRERSPTKSPAKKTKQKYSNVTPMDEDAETTIPWKTVVGKAVRSSKAKRDDSDEELWSSDEASSSEEEVKFIKNKKTYAETVLSSSDEEDDDSVEVLAVKPPAKPKSKNYYDMLAANLKNEYDSEDDEEDDDRRRRRRRSR